MSMRAYVRRWWANDPNVLPCKLCGCPIQALYGRMPQAMAGHFEVVHPGTPYTPAELVR